MRLHQFGKKVLSDILWAVLFMRREAGKETYSLQMSRNCKSMTLPKFVKKHQNKRSSRAQRRRNNHIPMRRWFRKIGRKKVLCPTIRLDSDNNLYLRNVRFLCHCSFLTLSGGQHWTCCKKVKQMIIGTLKVIGNHQGRGLVSPSSPC